LRRVSSQTIIGRDAQLCLLDDVLAAATAGDPRIIVLAGEAGVGKTRLIGELEARARGRGFLVLHGESVEFGGEAFPYAPLVAALRDVPGDLVQALDADDRDILATLLPRLGSGEPRFSSSYGQGRLSELVLHLLGELACEPLLMVLEDVHWADRSSRDFLAFLARNLRAERIAVAVTYRTGEVPPEHPLRRLLAELVRRPVLTLVEVAPLTQADVVRQLEAIAGRPVRAPLAAELHERSGGNPFFVEELFAAGADDVPATLADAVRVRVGRRSAPAQRLLAVLAAAGGRADHAVLEALLPDSGPALREARDAGLLTADDGGAALRHGLIGEVVYATLVPAERRELHAALAAALAAEAAPAAQLAYQWQQAGAHDDALAASVAAGLEAARLYAFAEARTHFERALELWDVAGVRVMDHVELLSRAAQAARYAGDRERAVVLGQRALAEVDEKAEPVHAARLYERLGEYASWDDLAALERYEHALGLLPPTASGERARLLAAQGHALMGLRRWEEARVCCEAALAASDAEPAAAAGLTLGLVLAFIGDAAAGEERLREALATAERLGAGELAARAYVHLGELLRLGGAHAEALDAMVTGERLAARLGMRGTFGHFMYVNAADDLVRLGRWDEAAQRLDEAQRLDLGITAGAMCHATAGHLDALRGDVERSRAHLQRADALAGEGLPGEFVAPISAAWATLALVEGEPERARRRVAEGLAALGEDKDPLYTPALYALGVRAGDERLLSDLDGLLGRSAPVPDALAHRATAYAECGSDPRRWEAAATLWEELSEPYPAAYARLRQAEALLAARGDRGVATALLTASGATADELGAAPLRREVEALARRARLRLEVAEERPAPDDGRLFTRREAEVLKLLAEGLTNRQIAERLFISEKTVGSHVAHIFEKLGVHSRVGAAGRAQALGIFNPRRVDQAHT
jgi:DNA-binding CsgD family transcriptional regulator/tetratricopeptide (TPR) repeat protein